MKTVLVVANETLGGRPLLAKIKELATQQEIRVVVCVPRTNPRQGNIIYDEAVFDFVVPQERGHGVAARQARARLTQLIDRPRAAGLIFFNDTATPEIYTAV